jgi:uncharacterized membrane protein
MKPLEINQRNILETKALLKEIIVRSLPFKDDQILRTALKSQGGLAKLNIPERGISACSLNTLKSASESLLDGGFAELNSLRLKANAAFEQESVGNKANKKTKIGLKHKVDQLELQLLVTRKCNYLLSVIISELRGNLKSMAQANHSRDFKVSEYHRINNKVQTQLHHTLKDIEIAPKD